MYNYMKSPKNDGRNVSGNKKSWKMPKRGNQNP